MYIVRELQCADVYWAMREFHYCDVHSVLGEHLYVYNPQCTDVYCALSEFRYSDYSSLREMYTILIALMYTAP